jgi:hypothetical protein
MINSLIIVLLNFQGCKKRKIKMVEIKKQKLKIWKKSIKLTQSVILTSSNS